MDITDGFRWKTRVLDHSTIFLHNQKPNHRRRPMAFKFHCVHFQLDKSYKLFEIMQGN